MTVVKVHQLAGRNRPGGGLTDPGAAVVSDEHVCDNRHSFYVTGHDL